MTRPSWLGRAARNRHRHAIEQASRRWRDSLLDLVLIFVVVLIQSVVLDSPDVQVVAVGHRRLRALRAAALF